MKLGCATGASACSLTRARAVAGTQSVSSVSAVFGIMAEGTNIKEISYYFKANILLPFITFLVLFLEPKLCPNQKQEIRELFRRLAPIVTMLPWEQSVN